MMKVERSRRGRAHSAATLRALLFVLPALLIVVGIVYAGIGYTGWASTTRWNGIDPNPISVGLGNYTKALQDPVFWEALEHVLIYAGITIVVQTTLGLIIAILVGGGVRFAWAYKVVMFLPVVLAPAAVSSAFRQILTPNGPVNEVLRSIGLDFFARDWLTDPSLALYSIAAINIWQWTGFSFILYQAALAQIDHDIFEAAQIDGAGSLRTVWSIVVPQLKGTHITLALMGVIGALKTFDIVFMTTGGGPGRSTEFLTTYIYKQAIMQFNAGYSAALSILMLLIAVLLTVVQMRVYRFGKD